MRHADDDFLKSQRTTAFDDLFHRGDQAFATIEAEALGAHVFDMEELLEPFSLDELVQDGFPAFARELDFLAEAFDPLFQPCGLLWVGDVHVLQRKRAAIGAAHERYDLVHRGDFEAQHIVDEDRAVHVRSGEAVGFRVQLRVRGVVAHAERIKLCDQVAANPVGADQHQRADGIENGGADLLLGEGDAFFLGFCLDLVAGGLGIGGPLAVERGGQLVIGLGRPIHAGP